MQNIIWQAPGTPTIIIHHLYFDSLYAFDLGHESAQCHCTLIPAIIQKLYEILEKLVVWHSDDILFFTALVCIENGGQKLVYCGYGALARLEIVVGHGPARLEVCDVL